MIRQIATLLVVLVGVPGVVSRAAATPITYSFDAPQFVFGETTPLLNRAPNSMFTGQFLIDPTGVADTLLLTFNTPVFHLQVDFGLFLGVSSPAGVFSLTTPVGSTSLAAGSVGGSFQGGTLVFDSAAPFLTAQLAGFTGTGTQIFFAVDDLVLDTAPVPEPATLVLVLTSRRGPPTRSGPLRPAREPQLVSVRQETDRIWLVSLRRYDFA